MRQVITVEFGGFKELAKTLKELPNKIAKRHLSRVMQKGSLYFRDQLKANAPRRTGALRDSIEVVTKRAPILEVKKYVEVQMFYGRLVEFGHRWVLKKGPKGKRKVVASGVVPPNPFTRRTFEAEVDATIAIIGKQLGRAVEMEAAKGGN